MQFDESGCATDTITASIVADRSNTSHKSKYTNRQINKWDLIRLKSFCASEEAMNKMERQPMEWEKIFANDVTNKGLISKIKKQLIQLKKQPNREMQTYIHLSPKKKYI